jgi:hypothetical protein
MWWTLLVIESIENVNLFARTAHLKLINKRRNSHPMDYGILRKCDSAARKDLLRKGEYLSVHQKQEARIRILPLGNFGKKIWKVAAYLLAFCPNSTG